jgi:putative hydrolase of the HAD superfamily
VLVLFDYGEVLSLPQQEEDVVAMARAAGMRPDPFSRRYWRDRQAYDAGELSDAEYWDGITERHLEPAEVAELTKLDVASWLRLNGDVVVVLLDLIDRQVPTALLSNAPETIAAAVDGLPALASMEARFFSARLHAVKPDPAVFLTVLAELGREAGDVVFVDDRPTNVKGARAVGLRAIQFRDATRLRRDLDEYLGE